VLAEFPHGRYFSLFDLAGVIPGVDIQQARDRLFNPLPQRNG